MTNMHTHSMAPRNSRLGICLGAWWLLSGMAVCLAQPVASAAGDSELAKTAAEDETVLPAPKLPDPENAKRLAKPDLVWIDAKNRLVYVDGYISLREGYLEMFACSAGTKEHESVVAVRARAFTIHTALLAVGATPGHPVAYQPTFRPASGTEIAIDVNWLDDKGAWKTARAQDWILDTRAKKPMAQTWVFAGSGFWKDEETGKEHYKAEAGDLICVSNFTTAMLDVPIESSQSNDALTFEANAKLVPELGTPVRLVLKPKLKEGAKARIGVQQRPARRRIRRG